MTPHPNTTGNVATCHRCKFRQKEPKGGFRGPCLCTANGRDIIANARNGNCPKELFPVLDAGTLAKMKLANAANGALIIAEPWGPAMWRRLHTAKDADERWLRLFTANVPCGHCKAHWLALLERMPPVYGEGWLAWTVAAHDEINELLGKPRMGIEAGVAKCQVSF